MKSQPSVDQAENLGTRVCEVFPVQSCHPVASGDPWAFFAQPAGGCSRLCLEALQVGGLWFARLEQQPYLSPQRIAAFCSVARGSVAMWQCDCVAVWQCGCVAAWPCGRVAAWQCLFFAFVLLPNTGLRVAARPQVAWAHTSFHGRLSG